MLYTNACSIMNKWAELKMEAHKFDCISITESWLKPDIAIKGYCPQGFTAYRSDRVDGRNGGGALLLIREHLAQTALDNLQLPNIQATGCVLIAPGRNVAIFSIYRSPLTNAEEDEQLLEYLSRAVTSAHKLLLTGDFNSPEIDWSNDHAPLESFGSSLLNFMHDKALVQHVKTPTRWRIDQTPNTLDLIVTKGANEIEQLVLNAPFGKSDHATISCSFRWLPRKPPPKMKRQYGKLDVMGLKEAASRILWPQEVSSVEADWLTIKDKLITLADTFAPLRNIRKTNRPLWWTRRVTKAQTRNRQAWKRYVDTQSHRHYLQYLRARSTFAKIQRECQRAFELRLAEKSKVCPKAYYGYVQSKTSTREAVGCIRLEGGGVAITGSEKAKALLEHFEKVHTPDAGTSCPPLGSSDILPMASISFSAAAVRLAIEHLNGNKSAGPDDIHPALLKPLGEQLAAPLAELFQLSLDTAVIPSDWQTAVVMPVFKGGVKEDANNYRPVSLLPVVLKLMEGLIRDRITEHLGNQRVLNQAQHGFRQRRSCLSNMLSYLERVTEQLDTGDEVDVCYLDFRKAFDSVNHRLLLLKLEGLGIDPKTLGWIGSYLRRRTFHVQVEGQNSSVAPIRSGVPQGSVLGPLLFLLYVNDLPGLLSCDTFMFADDIKIVGPLTGGVMQSNLDVIKNWADTWELPLNAGKCQRLVSEGAVVPCPLYLGNMQDGEVKQVNELKDLGITVNSSFTFSRQCAVAAQRANWALYQLRRSFASRDPEVLVPLYQMYVRPHLEYCVQAWSPVLVRDEGVIEKVQHRFTRLFPSLRNLEYDQRLQRLNLFSLVRRRKRGDLIEVFKSLKGLDNGTEHLFTRNENSSLRGHCLKLEKPRARTRLRASFFSHRVINPWNKLPNVVVESESLRFFKKNLDACWAETFPECS